MTALPDRVRSTALMLPEAEEGTADGDTLFLIAGEPFARLAGETLRVRAGEEDAAEGFAPATRDGHGWIAIDLGGEIDWPQVEDRIMRSWELAAPRRLIEAGGR